MSYTSMQHEDTTLNSHVLLLAIQQKCWQLQLKYDLLYRWGSVLLLVAIVAAVTTLYTQNHSQTDLQTDHCGLCYKVIFRHCTC